MFPLTCDYAYGTYDSTVYSFITFFLQVKQYKFSVLTLGAKYCVALFTTHAGSFP